jgi:hypothetical protein
MFPRPRLPHSWDEAFIFKKIFEKGVRWRKMGVVNFELSLRGRRYWRL